MERRTSKSTLHYPIRPLRQGDLNIPAPPGKPWGERLKLVWLVYSSIATFLFTAWLLAPAIADATNDTPRSDFPWTIMEPLARACTLNGGFEFKNELYSCAHAGTLGGDLRMPVSLTIAERQARLKTILPDSIWGYWINP